MQVITIELPIYYLDIIVVIDDWLQASKKFKLKLTEKDLEPCAWTIDNEDSPNPNEIYILFRKEYLDNNTILHELFHCISGLCEAKGIKMDSKNDEPLAYLQGYIGEKIFNFRDSYLEISKKRLPLS